MNSWRRLNAAGYIFDLDGTLVDSMPAHFAAWSEALREIGLVPELEAELFYSLGGIPSQIVAEKIATRYGISVDPRILSERKETLFNRNQTRIGIIEPVVDFARIISKTHPVAIASGGTRETVTETLLVTGLRDLFPIVVTATDVKQGKPNPEMFLLAASFMGVPHDECVVFEDAEPGIEAAKAASMRFVRINSRKSEA